MARCDECQCSLSYSNCRAVHVLSDSLLCSLCLGRKETKEGEFSISDPRVFSPDGCEVSLETQFLCDELANMSKRYLEPDVAAVMWQLLPSFGIDRSTILVSDSVDPCTGEVTGPVVVFCQNCGGLATTQFRNEYYLRGLRWMHDRAVCPECQARLLLGQAKLLKAWKKARPLSERGKCAHCKDDLTAETTWKVVRNGEVKIPEEHSWLKKWVGRFVCSACGRFLRAYCEVEGIYVTRGDKHRETRPTFGWH